MLLERAAHLSEAAKDIQASVTPEKITDIVTTIPDDWLLEESNPYPPEELRAAYAEYLTTKLANIEVLAKEAADAR